VPKKRPFNDGQFIENITEPYPLRIRKRQPITVTHPELASQWNYKKNKGFGPEDFSYGSNAKVWWICPKIKQHVWQATISNRTGDKA